MPWRGYLNPYRKFYQLVAVVVGRRLIPAQSAALSAFVSDNKTFFWIRIG